MDIDASTELLAAATRMRSAANDIKLSSINMKNAMEQHQRWMDNWLSDFRRIVDKMNRQEAAPLPPPPSISDDDDIPF